MALAVLFAALGFVIVSCVSSGDHKATLLYDSEADGPETQTVQPESSEHNKTEPPGNIELAELEKAPEEADLPAATKPPVKIDKKTYQKPFDVLRDKYQNDDIVGVVKIPGTTVYYPVAQKVVYGGPDTNKPTGDNDYYLNHNLYRQPSSAGSVVLDYENSVERYDPSTILYAHQMSYEYMFHTVSYYADEDFFNSHRYIIFNTIYENNVWEVFAFFKTHTDFDYIRVNFRSERQFLELAAEIKSLSVHETDIDIKEGDRILILSTCASGDPNSEYRYVLSARMIKNKDDIPPDTAAQMASAAEDFR